MCLNQTNAKQTKQNLLSKMLYCCFTWKDGAYCLQRQCLLFGATFPGEKLSFFLLNYIDTEVIAIKSFRSYQSVLSKMHLYQ